MTWNLLGLTPYSSQLPIPGRCHGRLGVSLAQQAGLLLDKLPYYRQKVLPVTAFSGKSFM